MLDVADSYRECRKVIELAVNDLILTEAILPEIDKWAYIAIIRDEDHPDYSEISKKSSKGKVLEFRLKISHEKFLKASYSDRIAMVLDSLDRSIDLMSGLNISDDNRMRIRGILCKVRAGLVT